MSEGIRIEYRKWENGVGSLSWGIIVEALNERADGHVVPWRKMNV